MVSRTAAQTNVATLASTGKGIIKSVTLRQTNVALKCFLQIFDIVAPTVGTDLPIFVMQLPALLTGTLTAVVAKATFYATGGGLPFVTGLSYAITTTATGPTSPVVGTEPTVVIHYENQH